MSEVEYSINHNLDGWPICKNGEPIFDNKTMLAELHSFQARVKELEAELATAREGWQETIAKMASQERPAYDEQQQRIAKLEAINLGLTKTLVEMEAEKATLVEALESAKNLIANHSGEALPDKYAGDQIEQIDAALSAYRKQGGK